MIKKIFHKEKPGSDSLTGELYQTFKEKLALVNHKFFCKK
jgi:hypothetical protein